MNSSSVSFSNMHRTNKHSLKGTGLQSCLSEWGWKAVRFTASRARSGSRRQADWQRDSVGKSCMIQGQSGTELVFGSELNSTLLIALIGHKCVKERNGMGEAVLSPP